MKRHPAFPYFQNAERIGQIEFGHVKQGIANPSAQHHAKYTYKEQIL